jgi:hypothetical protein
LPHLDEQGLTRMSFEDDILDSFNAHMWVVRFVSVGRSASK